MAFAAILCGVVAASAEDAVVAKVPFEFVVNGVVLPAGDYTVSRDARTPDLIAVTTADGRHRVLTLTRGGDDAVPRDQPKLAFERVGDQVFLTRVSLGPGSTREVIGVPTEEDAARG